MRRPRYRPTRRTAIVGVLAGLLVLVAAGMAVAAGREGPVTVRVGELEVTADGGFSPTTLSKTKQTPISIHADGKVKEVDGGHPPALREFVAETDKNGELHVKGIPTCRSGQLQATDTAAALAVCRPALVGQGSVVAQVAFPEQRPINVTSKLLLFNGGKKGGTTTWFAHAYFASPISGAIVTTVTIRKHPHGRFGDLVVGKIPQIAGGAGSGLSFNLDIFKTVDGVNPISARCADGKLKVHLLGRFEDGTQAQTEIIRTCTAKD